MHFSISSLSNAKYINECSLLTFEFLELDESVAGNINVSLIRCSYALKNKNKNTSNNCETKILTS